MPAVAPPPSGSPADAAPAGGVFAALFGRILAGDGATGATASPQGELSARAALPPPLFDAAIGAASDSIGAPAPHDAAGDGDDATIAAPLAFPPPVAPSLMPASDPGGGDAPDAAPVGAAVASVPTAAAAEPAAPPAVPTPATAAAEPAAPPAVPTPATAAAEPVAPPAVPTPASHVAGVSQPNPPAPGMPNPPAPGMPNPPAPGIETNTPHAPPAAAAPPAKAPQTAPFLATPDGAPVVPVSGSLFVAVGGDAGDVAAATQAAAIAPAPPPARPQPVPAATALPMPDTDDPAVDADTDARMPLAESRSATAAPVANAPTTHRPATADAPQSPAPATVNGGPALAAGATPDPPMLPLTGNLDAPVKSVPLSSLAGLSQQAAVTAIGAAITAEANGGANRFVIRLDPPELGRIDVRLRFTRDGELHARLIADRPETASLLARDTAALERALTASGVRTSDAGIDVTLRDSSGGFARSDGGSSAHSPAVTPYSAASGNAADAPAPSFVWVQPQTAAGRLDLRV